MLRVVLAEDNVLLREGLVRVLEREDDVALAGTAGDLSTLLRLIEENEPDVVVTDIRMPPTGTDEGIQASNQLRRTHPSVGVVVLSQYAESAYALALLADGAAGRAYLLKERVSDIDQLLDAVRTVAEGGSVIDPQVVELLVAANARVKPSELDRLTPRESEVLAAMAQGKSNGGIAALLTLSERAVEKHSNSIFSKLCLTEEREVNRRVKAVLMWLAERPHRPES